MSSYLLFCISQVPGATVDALLQTPRHNFFSLVRDSTQSSFDLRYTVPPVTPFESDFSDRSQIREFIANRLPSCPPGSNLEPCQYALLDEHSGSEKTVILAHSFSSILMLDPETMTEDEVDQWTAECEEHEDATDDSWCEWRVKFEDVERLSTILSFEDDFTPKLYNEDFVAAHTDAEGIFHLRSAFRAFAGTDLVHQD